jgi:Ca-activated chloride channel family protein
MNFKTLIYHITLATLMSLVSQNCLAGNSKQFDPTGSVHSSVGELELRSPSGEKRSALLLDTAITGQVNGMLASITVKQSFKNESADWLNGRYVFPLPEGAAVDGLRIEIGARVIDGVIKEKEQAIRTFKQAKRQGKKAALLQQHRPNLFSVEVANIGPFEQVSTKITFINQVNYQDGVFSLSLPTTLTPRYVPNATTKISKQQREQLELDLRADANADFNPKHGWATNLDMVRDIANITPPQTHSKRSKTSHRFSLDLSLRPGLDLQQVSSPTHPISPDFNSNEVLISLANGRELMDSDLILQWQPRLGTAPKAALFEQSMGESYYTMMMLTPPDTDTSISLPRDVTFIIDSSGSMAGQPMQQAKQALHDGLKHLNAGDRFNIIDFDSSYRALYSQSQELSFDHLQNAKSMIDGLRADGGTEMTGALTFALGKRQNSNFLTQIIFITDGAISNEAELFTLINRELGNARLFTIGIGSAPNAYFMSKAAKFGRGTYTAINDISQVQNKIATLFTKIKKPVLRNIKIKWPTAVEQYPQRLPDLYAGEPLSVLVKSSAPIDTLEASGTMFNTPWVKTLSIKRPNELNTENLDTLWARQKVASLMDKLHTGVQSQAQIKPLIVKLGTAHHIATKFTAFVAVENTPSKPELENAKQENVANLMPKGTTMMVPQTATSATLLSITGALMMLLSFLLRNPIRRKHSSKLAGLLMNSQAKVQQ